MATIDLTQPGDDNVVSERPYRVYQLENIIDFSAADNQLAQNDIAQAISVPANCFVAGVGWEVQVVEGAARNFSIGDGSDDDGYITSTSANSLATGHTALALTEATPNTVTGYTSGKFYTAADTIDVKAQTAGGLTACKLRVVATIFDYNV